MDGYELMNSRVHGSAEALAELACARVADRPRPRVLIGGLGMGYTLAEALNREPTEIRLGRGKHGKPFLEHPKTDLEFNVSHSGEVFSITSCHQ